MAAGTMLATDSFKTSNTPSSAIVAKPIGTMEAWQMVIPACRKQEQDQHIAGIATVVKLHQFYYNYSNRRQFLDCLEHAMDDLVSLSGTAVTDKQ